MQIVDYELALHMFGRDKIQLSMQETYEWTRLI